MERYLLDLENLPKAKKEVILQITSPLTEQGKTAFVRSLIFLGFAEIKQSEIDVDNANIGRSKHTNPHRVRVVLTNTKISKFLDKYPDQNSKRSCVYAFLYAGISCFIEYIDILGKSKDEKELQRIEKNLFLCGLGEYFQSEIKFTISQLPSTPPQQQPVIKTNKTAEKPKTVEDIGDHANMDDRSVDLNQPDILVGLGNQSNVDDKPNDLNQPEVIAEKPKSNKKSVLLSKFNVDGF